MGRPRTASSAPAGTRRPDPGATSAGRTFPGARRAPPAGRPRGRPRERAWRDGRGARTCAQATRIAAPPASHPDRVPRPAALRLDPHRAEHLAIDEVLFQEHHVVRAVAVHVLETGRPAEVGEALALWLHAAAARVHVVGAGAVVVPQRLAGPPLHDLHLVVAVGRDLVLAEAKQEHGRPLVLEPDATGVEQDPAVAAERVELHPPELVAKGARVRPARGDAEDDEAGDEEKE